MTDRIGLSPKTPKMGDSEGDSEGFTGNGAGLTESAKMGKKL